MADNFKYVQNQPTTLAGAGVVVGDGSITLISFTQIDGTLLTMTDFGTLGFGTIEPGNENEEQICFTGISQNSNGTATLTGVSSVSFVAPYTKTSNVQKNHVGGTIFVVSNTSGFYDQMTSKNDDETITGIYTFTDPNVPRMDVDHTYGAGEEKYFATYKLVQDTSYAGTVNATTTAKGISQLASDAQLQAGTETGSTGASVVAHGNNFTQTPTANKVPVANSSGKLAAGWGGAASTLATLNASSLVVENPANATATPTANKIPIANSSGQIANAWLDMLLYGTGSDGAVTLGAGTTTLSRDMYYTTLVVPNGATLKTNGYRVFAKTSITINVGGVVDFSGNNGGAGGNATNVASGSAGAGGAALNSGTVFGSFAGGNGGSGLDGSGNGNPGVAGTSSSDVYGVAGEAGGAGGNAGVSIGGSGGAAGTKADAGSRLQDLISLFQVSNARGGTINQITPSTGSGGGGAGGANAVGNYGGGGAGAPSGGGVIFFSTRIFTNNGTVSSNGGNGANGGNGYAAANAAGGGGASSGAPGGLIIIIANSIPSYGTLNVNGGTGGTGGAGGAAGGAAGSNGTSGSAGTVFVFII